MQHPIMSQQTFKKNLLEKYINKTCLICGHSDVEAAHIVDSSKLKLGQYATFCTENGLLLCPNHHSQFDKRQFVIKTWDINVYDNQEFVNTVINFLDYKTMHVTVSRNSYYFLRWRENECNESGPYILERIKKIVRTHGEWIFDSDGDAIM